MSENTPESWSRPESVNLPSELRISKFAEARVKEIIALSEFIGKKKFIFVSANQSTAINKVTSCDILLIQSDYKSLLSLNLKPFDF